MIFFSEVQKEAAGHRPAVSDLIGYCPIFILHQPLCDLNGIQGGAFFDLVADGPEGQAVGVG
jgi:hypothetical protein